MTNKTKNTSTFSNKTKNSSTFRNFLGCGKMPTMRVLIGRKRGEIDFLDGKSFSSKTPRELQNAVYTNKIKH